MKRAIVIVLIISLGLLLKSCNTTEPPPDGQSIILELEDVSCTEAWIDLTTANLQLPVTFTLKQTNPTGDTNSQILNLNTQDSLLYIDSLLPNTGYRYQVYCNEHQVSSNELTITTMDTTSHNFTFESWTFGTIGSSTLYDVAIIDENNIWAVGEILIADTSINGYTTYNAVHWDGSLWELKRINMLSSCNPVTYPPLKAIWAFSDNNIIVTSGGSIGWFDGVTNIPDCSIRPLLTGSINKIWGSSSNDLYVVGNDGNIAWYNGTEWAKIESGTDVDIQDIWGITNNNTTPFILCAVSYVAQLGEHKILRINNTEVDSINWGTGRRVHSIWFNSDKKIFVCGGGIFFGSAPNYNWIEQNDVPLFFTQRVRGKEKNDLFVVGDFGLLAHYNGVSWKTYPEAATAEIYKSLDYKNNLMVTVGLTETQAVIQFMFHN
jgi:hypothetical protein